jgi:hypothetical protein
LGSWVLDVAEEKLVDRAVVAETARAVLEVLDEALFFRDGVEFFGPVFEVTDTAGELDADLTRFGHRDLLRGGNR